MQLPVASCTSSRSKELPSLPDPEPREPSPYAFPHTLQTSLLAVAELLSDLRQDDAASP